MADKKTPGEVEASIARLRELRYMTRGPGAKVKATSLTTKRIEQLRTEVAAIEAKPPKPKKAKKKARRR